MAWKAPIEKNTTKNAQQDETLAQHEERIATIEQVFNENWEKIEERLLFIEQQLTVDEEEEDI